MPQKPLVAASLSDVERVLLEAHGPLLGGSALQRALGLPSLAAFRRAVARRELTVTTFTIPHRRGRFALTTEVARWLIQLREQATESAGSTVTEKTD